MCRVDKSTIYILYKATIKNSLSHIKIQIWPEMDIQHICFKSSKFQFQCEMLPKFIYSEEMRTFVSYDTFLKNHWKETKLINIKITKKTSYLQPALISSTSSPFCSIIPITVHIRIPIHLHEKCVTIDLRSSDPDNLSKWSLNSVQRKK